MCFPPSFFTISLMFLLLTRYPEHHLKCFWKVLMRLWRISMEIFRRQTSFGNFKIYFLCQGTHQLDVSHIFEKKRINMKNRIKFHLKIFQVVFYWIFLLQFYHFMFNLNSDISGIWYQCIFSSQTIFSIMNFPFWYLWRAWGDARGCGWLR